MSMDEIQHRVRGDEFPVLVVTAAIIDLYLQYSKDASISEFSLMVFDECHHARGNEPYNRLLRHYWKSLRSNPDAAVPQVRGPPANSRFLIEKLSAGIAKGWAESN